MILAGIQYKLNGINTSPEPFAKMTTTMNLVAVARFFEIMCCSIFEYLFVAGSKNKVLFGLISTYFGTVEINNQEMLHLQYLAWLCGAFHITQVCE